MCGIVNKDEEKEFTLLLHMVERHMVHSGRTCMSLWHVYSYSKKKFVFLKVQWVRTDETE